MEKTKKYENDAWSPITIKASVKTKLSEFKKAAESWTEVVERLLKIAEEKGYKDE